MKSQPCTFYFVHDAELLSDGVLRIRTGGSDGGCLFDGVEDVTPDNPDYEFWLWLTQRRKRHGFGFHVVGGLDEREISRYRGEYERECS